MGDGRNVVTRQCEIIKDQHGFWMEYYDQPERGSIAPKRHCVLMDAMTQKDAELEAIEEGFEVKAIIQ